jgi:uracil phosphoribosyltransferase
MNKSYTNETLSDIVEFLKDQPGSRPKVIAEGVGVSRQYVQKLLAKHGDLFTVTGLGPNRFYKLRENVGDPSISVDDHAINNANKDINIVIDNNFYSLTPLGEELIGLAGFVKWCNERNFDIESKKKEYASIINKYYPKGLSRPIDFTNKLKSAFNELALKRVWSVDYYNFEILGKTKLGNQVMIAKQTGDEATTKELVDLTNDAFKGICDKHKIEAVAFVSPTIQRQQQIMNRLDSGLDNTVPRVKIFKVGARILIAQITLKSIKDRILNAEQTFIVESPKNYDSVLIIDDALGSGATLNEIAKQMINKGIAKHCYGLVLVASPSGYEVIGDV